MELVEAARATRACRRLDLNMPVAVRPRSHPPSSFYSRCHNPDIIVPESPIRSNDDVAWQPGQMLPIDQPDQIFPTEEQQAIQEPSEAVGFDFQSMFQSMQHTMETHFDDVKKKLSDLEGRVVAIESKQSEIKRGQLSSPSSSSTEATPRNGRKKRINLDLQVIFSCCYVFVPNS